VEDAAGWELKVAVGLERTDPPTQRELQVLRDFKARTEASWKKA
jgi:glutaconate CoA-transferase, subunit B